MSVNNLDELDVEQLEDTIDNAKRMLDQRLTERREKAVAEARAILEKAGVSPKEFSKMNAAKKRAPVPLRQGDRYVNPDDAAQSWTVGRGRRPKWFADLEAKGAIPDPQ